MKYTYSKMVRECEKKVAETNLEIHAVKWMFYNSDFFCGYANLNQEVSEEIKEKFFKMVDRYINEKIPPQYILNKTFFFNYPFYEGKQNLKIADVCCGSGCIGITLKKEIENCSVYMCES